MALFIVYKIPSAVSSGRKCIEWHVGEKLPADLFDSSCESAYNSIMNVIHVQADGHELEWVEENFRNIPMLTSPVSNWYGDIARSIVAKIPEEL